ncbi:MAG: hypothetical protein HPY53_03795 [Brevinematales bacterium]|nr:hypothetical protein [Brevinematales bacterium]
MRFIKIYPVLISFLFLSCGAPSVKKYIPIPYTASGNGFDYAHKSPPVADIPIVLQGDKWLAHYTNDLLPYWTMPDALGDPQGNFPTYRQMDGAVSGDHTARYPRMIGRQVFVYSMGFLMTGDTKLLQYAKDGIDWLTEKAKDTKAGGWYPMLDAKGNPYGKSPKTAQDLAYTIQGFAAYFFVTRDPAAEKEILESCGLIFDPAKYWDAPNQRVKNAMDFSMQKAADSPSDGWDLVAQLDQINAYMLLSQPVLTEQSNRQLFLERMKLLAEGLVANFWEDGIFWGANNMKGKFPGPHLDFGHTLKSYWMILRIDKRLPGHPFSVFLSNNVYFWVDLAYQESKGMWADKMSGYDSVQPSGRSWWIYAECDQLTADLNLIDYRYTPVLEKTAANWVKFIDTEYLCGEVYPGVSYSGGKSGNGNPASTSKCNEWKNGFHTTEHALVMYILGKNLEGKPVDLYFAVPPSQADTFIAKPYLFEGTEVTRANLGNFTVDGTVLTKVKVTFKDIY